MATGTKETSTLQTARHHHTQFRGGESAWKGTGSSPRHRSGTQPLKPGNKTFKDTIPWPYDSKWTKSMDVAVISPRRGRMGRSKPLGLARLLWAWIFAHTSLFIRQNGESNFVSSFKEDPRAGFAPQLAKGATQVEFLCSDVGWIPTHPEFPDLWTDVETWCCFLGNVGCVLSTRCRVGSHTCARSPGSSGFIVEFVPWAIPQLMNFRGNSFCRESQAEIHQPQSSSSEPRRGWVDWGAAAWQECIDSQLWRQYLSSPMPNPTGKLQKFH